MIKKYYNINAEGCSIRCKQYSNDARNIREIVLSLHGFGGHKEAMAVEHFAEKYLSKRKNAAVVIFDWPCHGEDGRKKLTLSDCDSYIRLTLEYLSKLYEGVVFYNYSTSFGGYMVLRYIHEYGNPFRKIVLRCPAIELYELMITRLITPEKLEQLLAGKDVLIGFDREIKISKSFIDELKACNLTQLDFMDFADDILIIHGTKDEIVPFDSATKFADDNVIEFIPIEKADHRFMEPTLMNLAIAKSLNFMFG